MKAAYLVSIPYFKFIQEGQTHGADVDFSPFWILSGPPLPAEQ